MEEPTIGRVVHVCINGQTGIYPAIIHAVHGPNVVSVNCFSWNGPMVLVSVTHGKLDASDMQLQCWDWPVRA
jgi:hypothetical protein